jgi:hypothetical protein
VQQSDHRLEKARVLYAFRGLCDCFRHTVCTASCVEESERPAGAFCHSPEKEGLAQPGFTNEKADAGDTGQGFGQPDTNARDR